MGILQKMTMLVRSNLTDLIHRAEDPEKILNQTISDMREELTRAKHEAAAAIADEKRIRSDVETEIQGAMRWQARAELAITENRDDLARQALTRHQECVDRARQIHEIWERQAAETEKLKEGLRQISDRVEEVSRKRNLLIARHRRSEAQNHIRETLAEMSAASTPAEAFRRLEVRIDRDTAEADALTMLAADPLEDDFKLMESGGATTNTDLRLMEMKERLGLLSSVSPCPSWTLPTGEAGAADS